MNTDSNSRNILVTSTFDVTGMTCSSCANAIKNTLTPTVGLKSIQINLLGANAQITYDQSLTKLADWNAALAKLGFSLSDSQPNDAQDKVVSTPVTSKAISPSSYLMFSLLLGGLIFAFRYLAGNQPISYTSITTDWGFGFILVGLLKGQPLYIGFRRLLAWQPGMESLIFLSTAFAGTYSLLSIGVPELLLGFGLQPMTMLDGPLMVLLSVTIGRMLEQRVKQKANDALLNLIKRLPSDTLVKAESGNLVSKPINDLTTQDLVIINAGQVIPIDGIVTHGTSEVDEQIITGESVTVLKSAGAQVMAGTLNITGSLQLQLTGTDPAASILNATIDAIRKAQMVPSKSQGLADRVAAKFIPIVIGVSILSLMFWVAIGLLTEANMVQWAIVTNYGDALSLGVSSMITVLIVSCPCALGLATPIVLVRAISLASSNGILIRQPDGLEQMARATDLVLDKTGTLTLGQPIVIKAYVHPKFEQNLHFAQKLYALAATSHHPVAKAVSHWAESKLIGYAGLNLIDYSALDANSIVGNGQIGTFSYRPDRKTDLKTNLYPDYAPQEIMLGKPEWIKASGALIPIPISKFIATQSATIASEVWVSQDGMVVGCFYVQDEIRPDAKKLISWAQTRKLNIHLLSGDVEGVVKEVSHKLGILLSQSLWALTPTDKAKYIEQLKASGKIVVMVGDGVNDGPSLALADVSIAVGGGSDIAKQTASVTLMGLSLKGIDTLALISKQVSARIKENLIWAFGYNLFMIPMAAGISTAVLHIHNIHIWAGASMAISSLTVVLNSIRMKATRSW